MKFEYFDETQYEIRKICGDSGRVYYLIPNHMLK